LARLDRRRRHDPSDPLRAVRIPDAEHGRQSGAAYPRFWSPGSAGYPHIWDFLKNFGLVGGLLLIVLGSDLVAPVERAAKEISASEIVHVQAD
jgi:hypothetical protein